MPSEIASELPPEILALLPPETVSALSMLTLPVLIVGSLLISLPFALAGYWVARKKGLNVRYWTILGFALGPFVLPFLLFVKKKNNGNKT